MKLLIIACKNCTKMNRVPFCNNYYYKHECSCGTVNYFYLEQQDFEILFDIGAYSILEGNYREAVVSFASSLDKFYEFFVKANYYEKKLDDASVEAASKQLYLSERIFGGYYSLYLYRFKKTPHILKDINVKLRNKVVHRGLFPDKMEALKFGENVLDIIQKTIDYIYINKKYRIQYGIKKIRNSQYKIALDFFKKNNITNYNSVCMSSVIKFTVQRFENEISLEQKIDNLKRKWGFEQ